MKSSSFLRFFPPPDFLNPLCVGVSVSDTSIRAFEFEHVHNVLTIRHYSEYMLSPGVVVSGEIHNKDEVISVLREMRKHVSTSRIRASLPEEKAYLFKTSIPETARSHMREAIEPRLEENVPLSAANVLFDFNVVNQEIRHKDRIDVVVSVIPTAVVDAYMDVFTQADLLPYRLEIESQAIARSVFQKYDTGTHMIIHCAPEKIGLYIVSDRIVHFTSTMTIKDPSVDVSGIAKEIQKIIMYWSSTSNTTQEGAVNCEHVVVTGEGFDPAFVHALSAQLKRDVQVGNVWTNVFDLHDHVPRLSFIDSVKYAPTIGLALPTHVLL